MKERENKRIGIKNIKRLANVVSVHFGDQFFWGKNDYGSLFELGSFLNFLKYNFVDYKYLSI